MRGNIKKITIPWFIYSGILLGGKFKRLKKLLVTSAFLLIEMNAWKARHFQNAVFSTHNPAGTLNFKFIGALVIKPVGINFG